MEYHQHRYARALEAHVASGCRWLDLGAGTRLHGGWKTIPPATLVHRAKVLVGCDLLAAHLRAHPHLTERVVASGERLPFAAGAFDLVTANMVMEHLSDPTGVLREIARVLTPGGRFVFVTPHKGHPAVATAALLLHPSWRSWLSHRTEHRERQHIFRTFYRANTLPDLTHQAAAAGLGVVQLDPFSSHPITDPYAGLRWIESQWIRLIEQPWGARWRSNLLGVLERSAPENAMLSPIPATGRAAGSSRSQPEGPDLT